MRKVSLFTMLGTPPRRGRPLKLPGMTSEQCEQKAVECLRLAQVMLDSTNKALLHQMALAWIKRANQIKRSVSFGKR
jgi:hypothetical protein